MDEFERLKSIWQQAQAEADKPKEDIARMLQGESLSIVSRLKRNVWFELLFTIVTGLLLLYWGLSTTSSRLLWMLSMLMIVCLAFLFYYTGKLRLLNRFSITEGDIKSNLQHLTAALQGYLRFYKLSYIVLYPVFFVAVLWATARDTGTDIFLEALKDRGFLMIFLLITTAILITAYVLTGWYLKKLYGNHLEKLQRILNDLTQTLKE